MSGDARRLPMFPLGRVLLPGEALPLRVFEPRYLAMTARVLAGTGEFGVVLIERGSEVGGGDERRRVGTVAAIAQMGELVEEQLTVVAVGRRRIEVVEWLPEDPYPLALVVEPDGPAAATASEEAPATVDQLARRIRRLYALASELGADVSGHDLSLPDTLTDAVWRLCSMVPAGQLDRQVLLEAPDLDSRLDVLDRVVADAEEELTLRLAHGS